MIFVAAVGCGACSESTGLITSDTYVDVMGELSAAQVRYLDEAPRDSAREAILVSHGVSAQDVIEFSEEYGGDLPKMTMLFERIRQLSDSIAYSEVAEGLAPGSVRDSAISPQP